MNQQTRTQQSPDLPPALPLEEAAKASRFLLEGQHGNLWFEQRSPILFVTFDNLATLDDPYPRLPWMHARVRTLDYSILGVQTFRKDWFRQPTSAAQIMALAGLGFFDRFERVIFMGASMGAFAALNFAPLVPSAWALVFSPQSTMSRKLAPFEKRFPFAVKRSDWVSAPFLDAAAAIPYIPRVAMFYDPLEMEDKCHAARLDGPQVQHLAFPCATHQGIRLVVKCDALPEMMREFAETGRLGHDFFRRMRARKNVRSWRRALLEQLEKRNHPAFVLRASDIMLRDKHYAFAEAARSRMLERHPEAAL